MDSFFLFLLLLSCSIQVGAKMRLSPETLTVLRGEEARFTCSPSKTKWTAMVWLLNGEVVLTISKEFGLLPSVNPNVTAEKGSVSSGDSWVFVLKKTERNNEGQVTCDLQGSDRRRASLLVQVAEVVQQEDGCTAPLAVTASLSAILLLILLCICTILCYQHRRQAKPSPQEAAIWLDQSVSGRTSVAEARGGKVNLGYSSEGPTDPVYNELNLETRRQQQDFVSFLKVPDVVSSSSLSLHNESQAQVCLSEETATNIRRITTV
ncbi:uncharacterized protein igsf5b isoform X2 [Eleginops maclovinus]|uniref:uncharacterized protein igsf5b isoform X2 n=1 Tax=Eleginops maclovinus TaxID=56733 RepID=UPI00308051E0